MEYICEWFKLVDYDDRSWVRSIGSRGETINTISNDM